jgi:Ca2+-binding RTX toxin-like protein
MRIARSCTAATLVFIVAASTGAAVAVPSPSPSDSRGAATCQGLPATIESSVQIVYGTPGNDVIVVTGDVRRVKAGEGDDVICVVANESSRLKVLAGPGADLVDTTAATEFSNTLLGTGTDTFIGGPHTDYVIVDQELAATTALDVVRTGDGGDLVFSDSAVDADLGPGDDFYVAEFTEGQSGSRVLLGKGRDEVRLDADADLHFNLSSGTLLQSGVQGVVTGAEEVIANAPKVWVRGTRSADELTTGGCDVTLFGGGGHDELTQVKGFEVKCGKRQARLYGQGGPDILRAADGNDVLIGGSGPDRAVGGGGRDRCVAEKTSACER